MYTLPKAKEESKAYDNRQQLSPISAFRDEDYQLLALSSAVFLNDLLI